MRSNKQPQNCDPVSLKFVLLNTTFNFFHTTKIIFASPFDYKNFYKYHINFVLQSPISPMTKIKKILAIKAFSQHELKSIPNKIYMIKKLANINHFI